MRNTYIVTYDICDDKRLRKVFKTIRNWGNHIQYSVFECQLSRTELLKLKNELNELIHHEQDQVLFIDLGDSEGRSTGRIDSLGQRFVQIDAPCLVV